MGLADHQPRTRHVALPMMVVVGAILLAVNQGAELMTGNVDAVTVLRALANCATRTSYPTVGFLNGYEQTSESFTGGVIVMTDASRGVARGSSRTPRRRGRPRGTSARRTPSSAWKAREQNAHAPEMTPWICSN